MLNLFKFSGSQILRTAVDDRQDDASVKTKAHNVNMYKTLCYDMNDSM